MNHKKELLRSLGVSHKVLQAQPANASVPCSELYPNPEPHTQDPNPKPQALILSRE